MIEGPKLSYRIVGQNRRNRFSEALDESHFDLVLLDRKGIPAAALEAPLASWVLARLTAEAGLGGAYADARHSSDGGAYSLNLEVCNRDGAVVGAFELLGYTWCVELYGGCEGIDPDEIVEDFAGLLLARPEKLGKCRVSVYDNEWNEHPEEYDPRWPAESDRNVYGWNGDRFLGGDNFWNASEVQHPWPGEDYRAYHERALAEHRASRGHRGVDDSDEFPPAPENPDDPDDQEEELVRRVVEEARAQLESLFASGSGGSVRLRVYDLDGRLVQDDSFSEAAVVARLESWIGDGFSAAWRLHEDRPLVKVWEYPASEPPWETVLQGLDYEPQIRP